MLSLATHQSAVWGYDSKLSYDATSFTYNGSVNFIGSWTTPTLAPNGKLYSILSCASTTATGSENPYVIAIITPNNANHTSTNWTAATVEYISADGSANKPYWNPPVTPVSSPTNNALIRFSQKGILAANGKIYFMPFKGTLTGGELPKWVVLTPGTASTTTWEVVSFANTSNIAGALGGCVAGKDGYLYVIPNTDNVTSSLTACSFFRIHPKNVTIAGVTALTDIAYIGYWTGLSGRRFYADNLNTLTWRNSSGVTATDTATGANNKGISIDTNNGSIADMIVHTNGNIYILPRSNSRGRIFYIKPSNFGTAQEVCSETGLHINQISGGSGLFLACHSAFYESKKDDPLANNNLLNIFITPNVQFGGVGIVATTNFLNIIKLYGATNTLTSIAYTPISTGTSTDNLMTAFPVSNGTIMLSNIGTATSKSLDQLITGEDVSSTYKLVTSTNSNGIIAGTSAQVAVDFGIGNAATNRRDISSYHVGVDLSKSLVITNLLKITELLPVKGYHPGVTYFNSYLSKETGNNSMYKIPTNVTTTPISLYNSQKNKLK